MAETILQSDSASYNNGTTVETDLATYTIAANTLNVNGKGVRINAYGVTAANANTKRLRLYFAGTVIFDSTAQVYNGRHWHFMATVLRTGAATQDAFTRLIVGGTVSFQTINFDVTATPAGDTTLGIITKVTGQSNTASNDITQRYFSVEFLDLTP